MLCAIHSEAVPKKRVFLWPEDAQATEPEQRYKTRTGTIRITDIETPYLDIFRAESKDPTPAVVVCPGGSYKYICIDKEGTELAVRWNPKGITVITLAYSGPGTETNLSDAQRAMRLIRHHAKAWNIDPDRIGIMGFSASGHLATRLCAEFKNPTYEAKDEADKLSARPDFCVLVYPAYLLGANDGNLEFTPGKHTPPTTIIHASDDRGHFAGSAAYFKALQAARVPSTFFRFEKGGHGHGLRVPEHLPIARWSEQCEEWLRGNVLISHPDSDLNSSE